MRVKIVVNFTQPHFLGVALEACARQESLRKPQAIKALGCLLGQRLTCIIALLMTFDC